MDVMYVVCERKWWKKKDGYDVTSVRVFNVLTGESFVGRFQFMTVGQAVSELVGRNVGCSEFRVDSVRVGRRSDLHWVGDQ